MAMKSRETLTAQIDSTLSTQEKVRVTKHNELVKDIIDSMFNKISDNGVIFGNTPEGTTQVSDVNKIEKSGFYSCDSNAAGAPNSSYNWFILHQQVGKTATQRAIAVNNKMIVYERVNMNDSWSDWQISGGADSYTYAQLKAMADNNELIAGKYYLLSDYKCYSPSCNYYHTDEPLLLLASASNQFAIRAFSLLFPTDAIYYDFADNLIIDNTGWGYDAGGSPYGVNSLTILSSKSFEIDCEIQLDNGIGLEIQQGGECSYYDESNIGTEFNYVSENGKTTFTFADTENIDLTQLDENEGDYIWGNCNLILGERTGKMLRRYDAKKKIMRNVDWRGTKVRKYLTHIQTWDASAQYMNGELVQHNNNKVYRSIMPFYKQYLTGTDVPGTSIYWVDIGLDARRLYASEYDTGQGYLDLPLFAVVDWNTLSVDFADWDNLNCTNLDMSMCDNDRSVFVNTNIDNSSIASGNIFVDGYIEDCNISGGNELFLKGGIRTSNIDNNNTIYTGDLIHNCTIGTQNSLYVKKLVRTAIGNNNQLTSEEICDSKFLHNNRMGSMHGYKMLECNVGSQNLDIVFKGYQGLTMGNRNKYLASDSDIYDTSIANNNQYIRFSTSVIGSQIGSYNRGRSLSQPSVLKIGYSKLGDNSKDFYLDMSYSTLNTFVDNQFQHIQLFNSYFDKWSYVVFDFSNTGGDKRLRNIQCLSQIENKTIVVSADAHTNTSLRWIIRNDGNVVETSLDANNVHQYTQLTS